MSITCGSCLIMYMYICTWLFSCWCSQGEWHSHKDYTCSSIHATQLSCGDPPRSQAKKCAGKFTKLSMQCWWIHAYNIDANHQWPEWHIRVRHGCDEAEKTGEALPHWMGLVPYHTWYQRCLKKAQRGPSVDVYSIGCLYVELFGKLDWMAQK